MKNNTPVTIQLGEEIAALRSYLGLSQAAFAKPLQLSPTHIARFEKGISKPTEAVIKQVCDVFEVADEYFTGSLAVEDAVKKKNPEAGIPERMKAARDEKGWSQYRLAKESMVAQAVINRVEAGATLTEKQGMKVAEALEVGYDWLMYGIQEKEKYPADQKMIDWLWKHEDARKEVWEKMMRLEG